MLVSTKDIGKTNIQFIRSWKGYQTGETAGFSVELARELISSGVAIMAKKKSAKAQVTKPHKSRVTK